MGVAYWLAHRVATACYTRLVRMTSHHHPAALRNRQPIVDTLKTILPTLEEGGAVLELASGSGCHAEHIAAAFPAVDWQPSELTEAQQETLVKYFAGSKNVRPALLVDASTPATTWGVALGGYTLVYASNVTHISPYEATLGLLAGAAAALKPAGSLVIYGPFKVNNEFTTESNKDFDADLRTRNALWGYRDIGDIVAAAAKHGLVLVNQVAMPANNFLLQFVKRG